MYHYLRVELNIKARRIIVALHKSHSRSTNLSHSLKRANSQDVSSGVQPFEFPIHGN